MKIAFWSPMHGTGATSGLLATAIALTENCGKKVLVTQNHYDMNNMEKPLLGKIDDREFFGETGLDAIIRHFKSGNITGEQIVNCTIGITDKFHLLAGTKVCSREAYENSLVRNIVQKVMSLMDKYYDVVLVDTNSGNDPGSFGIMEESDLIVVSMRQNREMIDEFMKNSFFDNRKIFYLFGNYDETSKYSLQNLRHIYRKIRKDNSGGIPHSTGYMDAICDERVMRYMQANFVADGDYYEEDFFKSISEIAKKMLILAGKEV